MPTRKARSPFAGVRKLLLAALVLVVLGIAGLFLFGKAGQRPEKPARSTEEEETQGAKGMTLIGEDFDYTFTQGARPIFHIKGVSIKADREGTIFLDRVAVTLWDKQGRIFHVESKKASFNREANEGQLMGNVVLRGPEQMELHTARLDLQQKGDVVSSDVPVELHYGGKYIAHAGKLTVDIPGENYALQGGAEVESVPGVVPAVSVHAQRLIYDRQQHWLRAEGGTTIRRGADWLSAVRIYGNMSEDETTLTFVHAFWEISGETHSTAPLTVGKTPGKPPAVPTTVRFKGGKDLVVAFQPEQKGGQPNQPSRVEMEAPDGGRVQMDSVGGGIVRTLTARRVGGSLENRVLSSADAVGGVEIREVSKGPDGKAVLRQATGQRGSATFKPDGQLATMDLVNNVVYHDGQATATGDRGAIDMDQARGEFVGNPVVVTSDRGRIEAPRMVYNTDQQIVNARGGVKALLTKVEETEMSGTPLASGQGPVHIESQEGFWRQQPSSFIFRGDVRAWQGDNLLLAPELRGDKTADQLTATGGVKTLYYPTQEQAQKASTGTGPGEKPARPGAQPAAKPTPIQASASELQYTQKSGVLIYTGNVRVDQEGKTITCQKMEVDLGADHQAKTMICTGDVKVNDPKVGRKIAGQKAVYQTGQRQVEITGEPVVMNDKEGNQVRGKRVLYYVDDGRAVVQGKEGEENPPPAMTSPPKPQAPPKPQPPSKPPGQDRSQGRWR